MSFPIVQLGEICTQVRGVSYGKDEVFETPSQGTIPLLRATNIQADGTISKEAVIYVLERCVGERQHLSSADVLITASTGSKSAIGRPGRLKDGGRITFGAFCKVIRPNLDRVDPGYFWFLFVRPEYRIYISSAVSGANINNIRNEHVDEMMVPLPPLPIQRHIAKVLEQADSLRRQAQQMEAELERLAQALFLEMFGNLFTNPKRWPEFELGSLIEVGPKNGLYKHSDDYGSGTPIVRIDNFYSGELTDPASFKRVSLTEAEQEKFGLENHSILINRVNSPEYLGKVALVENLTELTVFESNMMNFMVDKSRINPVFLVTQLGSQFIRDQIRKASKDASNQSSINQGDVRAFRVVVPPIAEQNRFACLLANIRHVRNMGSERSSMLEQAFQSLMQRAFKGELTPKLA